MFPESCGFILRIHLGKRPGKTLQKLKPINDNITFKANQSHFYCQLSKRATAQWFLSAEVATLSPAVAGHNAQQQCFSKLLSKPWLLFFVFLLM